MAGTIIADYIRTDANKLSLNVGNTTFATINATGLYSNTGTQIIDQNGQVSADSIQTGNLNASLLTTGTVPKARMPSGSVLQVVAATYATPTSTTSGTFVDTGFTFSITPTFSNSKILIMARAATRTVGYAYGTLQFVRGSSTILSPGPSTAFEVGISTSSSDMRQITSYVYLDSPATTSLTTYKVQMASWSSSTYEVFASSNPMSVVMMEIAG